MVLQYSVFIVICYIVFLAGSICMIPFAYLKCITTKLQTVSKSYNLLSKLVAIGEILMYILVGVPLLLLGLGSDFYYFWANNFRSNLKQIIIVRKESHVTNESIKMLTMFCSNYNHEKIKALKAVSTIKTFRERF